MKIIECSQGSVEWMQARSGIPTASDFDQLVTPEWKVRTGQMPTKYTAKKLAEWWLGGPLASFNTFDMEQGRVLEEEAIPWFELATGLTLSRVGFITDAEGTCGCSPDALSRESWGIEIKCPMVHTHVCWLLSGGVPKDHLAQIQGSMYVTGFLRWRFLSYCRRLPAIDITVDRDESAMQAIDAALVDFRGRFEAGKQILMEANGGPPKRPPPFVPRPPEPAFLSQMPS